MITLNDYLYSGDTVLKILLRYSSDLRNEAIESHNSVDLAHSNFLIQIIELLEHTDFLTSQSQRIKEFYLYMTQAYPFLAFTFKGRIKSLIRAEEKFNGYILEYIYNYYKEHGTYPSEAQIKNNLNCFRDLIAYRIVISLPMCHVSKEEDLETQEIRYLYEIANALPGFLEERGFDDNPVTYRYSMDGVLYDDEVEADGKSSVKHPRYNTIHTSENGDVWNIFLINGEIYANPMSFNLESELPAQLLFSESKTLTSYKKEANKFFLTIPKE